MRLAVGVRRASSGMFDLSGRTALVTGGGRDIGAACALSLAQCGADVVVNYNSSSAAAAATVAAIEAEGRFGAAVQADVFTEAGVAQLAEGVAAVLDGHTVDILVCNAGGLNVRGELHELDMATFRENFDMNFFSAVMCCKAFIPAMVTQGWGRVVLMGSIAGNNGGSGTTTPHYGPAKAATHTLARSLTQTYARHGVNTNAIAPGVIDNGFHAKHTSKQNMDGMVARIAQGRPGRNEEVGAVCAFLASPAASHVCGDVIHVNGGMLFGS